MVSVTVRAPLRKTHPEEETESLPRRDLLGNTSFSPEVSFGTDKALDTLEKSVLQISTLEAGTAWPWGEPGDDLVRAILNFVDGDSETLAINDWKRKISNHISGWRAGFALIAADVLLRFLVTEAHGNVDKPEVVKRIIHKLWGPVGKTRPIWWRECSLDKSGRVIKQGRLQHPLVIEIFSKAHFADYMTGPDLVMLSKYQRPRGAYLLSVQAIEHAIHAWDSGFYVNNLAEFTIEKHADYIKAEPSFDLLYPRSTFYSEYIDKFSNDNWVEIFIAAANNIDRGRVVVCGENELDMDSD